jgi:hypothetical protein
MAVRDRATGAGGAPKGRHRGAQGNALGEGEGGPPPSGAPKGRHREAQGNALGNGETDHP